ncbi:hypothetical protein [Streptomyces sp. DH37]|uniref:hypothetical protein n=1 Tax=Streptomyces sp. DH37 TaxID=3040122 RepID=UPI0024424F52|nr:hypothetical protein [Streptomyces sp. DH37]MDG9705741.1 hypothetical protein [Streptomyces sp. DH37]
MKRARSGVFVVALIAVLVSACGSAAPETSTSELFGEYVKSTDVRNDVFTGSETSEDRLANIAAHYNPEQLKNALFSSHPCDPGSACAPTGAAGRAVRDFAGADGKVFERRILAKRENGSLELITLYVARKPDGAAALVDSNGESYTGGLEDFRENNDLLGPDDVILTPRDITSVSGEGKLVTVYGHTAANWVPWLAGGAAVALLLGTGLVLLRRPEPRHWDFEDH